MICKHCENNFSGTLFLTCPLCELVSQEIDGWINKDNCYCQKCCLNGNYNMLFPQGGPRGIDFWVGKRTLNEGVK